MTKQQVYQWLNEQGISYEIAEHPAVFNMEEMHAVKLPHPSADAKNLFVRDDKKQNYYMITVKGDKRVNLKAFQRAQGLRRLTFASSEDLRRLLGLIPGAVTPLGLLCDEDRKVTFYLDEDFADGLVGVHPCDNTATVFLKAEDLMRLVREHGNLAYAVRI